MVQPPRFLPCGDSALTVEFGSTVDPELNAKVLALDEALRSQAPKGLLETVPTYRSLTVQFDPAVLDYDVLIRFLTETSAELKPRESTGKRWRVPVVYGGEFGVDLESVAESKGLTPHEVIEIFSSAVYRIYLIGFMPGYAYLGGLNPRLVTSRRTHPRPKVPSGVIMIGGEQAGIVPMEMPSGWHLLGRTPVRSYAPERDPTFLFEAGDEIVFEPIDASRWDALEKAALAGEPVAEQVRS
jgi:KipI family sensor histidine kinase inhibitor